MTGDPHWMHPQAQKRLDAIIASGEPPLESLDAVAARAIADERVVRTAGPGPQVARVEERAVPGPGGSIPLRIYRASADGGPAPVLVYIHGGGCVVGNLDTVDTLCRELTAALGCVTVSIAYRLAPEHKFPAAFEDCYAATRWVAAHVDELGGMPGALALAGESSGGTLAAAVSAKSVETGDFRLLHQVMVYPGTDAKLESASYERLAEGYFLTKSKMRWFVDHYLRTPEDADDPRASPLRAACFAGLPPTLVVTASLDPLVDEGRAYAERLKAAGVPTEHACAEGWPHGYMYWPEADARRETMDLIVASLRRAFAEATGAASSQS